MAFFKGTATDYRDMLDIIKNLVKDDHIQVADIYDGGTGYAVGDTITLASGTKTHEPELEVRGISAGDYITVAAVNAVGSGYNIGDSLVPTTGTYIVAPVLEVLTVSGTAVATILIKNPGIASAQPSNPVSTTSDGSGTGCTIDFTFAAATGIITTIHIADAGVYTSQASNPVAQNTSSGSGTGAKFEVVYVDTAWETKMDYAAEGASAAAISAAGTGYTAADIVTVVGGSFAVAATVKILTVSGGVPQTIEVHTEPGEYISTPGNPAATSGGTGTGLTLTMTWGTHPGELKFLMIHNTVSDQYIGWRAHKETDPETAYNLQCTGFSGFNTVNTPWHEQPGATTAIAANRGTFVPLSGGGTPATINYWMNVQDLRIACGFRVGSTYPNMYLGGFDTFLTDSEWAYPQIILGCNARERAHTYGGHDFSGMNNPGAFYLPHASYPGPGWLRAPGGELLQICNWDLNGGVPQEESGVGINVSPSGGVNSPAPTGDNDWYSDLGDDRFTWREMFTEAASIEASQDELKRVGTDFVLLPATLSSEEHSSLYGNMTGIFSLNPDAAVVAEDRIWIGTVAYRCFSNCAKSNRNFFFAIRED